MSLEEQAEKIMESGYGAMFLASRNDLYIVGSLAACQGRSVEGPEYN